MTHKCLSQDEAAEGNLGGALNRGAPARRARQAKFPSLLDARSCLFPTNLPAPAALTLRAGWEASLEAGQQPPGGTDAPRRPLWKSESTRSTGAHGTEQPGATQGGREEDAPCQRNSALVHVGR